MVRPISQTSAFRVHVSVYRVGWRRDMRHAGMIGINGAIVAFGNDFRLRPGVRPTLVMAGIARRLCAHDISPAEKT